VKNSHSHCRNTVIILALQLSRDLKLSDESVCEVAHSFDGAAGAAAFSALLI
jgi:hypothetical protein